jgi:hypothetical protein
MIAFRLNVAGYRGELFEDADEAYKTLFTYSKGLPRDAIKICFELFIELVGQNKKQETQNRLKRLLRGKIFAPKHMGRFDALTQLEDKPKHKTPSPGVSSFSQKPQNAKKETY